MEQGQGGGVQRTEEIQCIRRGAVRIGGLQRFSLVDYPGKVSAVVFLQGCNFRCPYCHNPQLVYPMLFEAPMAEADVLQYLKKRRGMIQGVVISGGEALLQEGLAAFLGQVKDMGYPVKLDTNGSFPDHLEMLTSKGLIDYVALDYKAPVRLYAEAAGVAVSTRDIIKSVRLCIESRIRHEARTTVFDLLSGDDLEEVASELRSYGVQRHYLQMYRKPPGSHGDLSPCELDKESQRTKFQQSFQEWGIRNVDRRQVW
ncbi:MAG TPA: anaerobic ribonucleoside-triphosphate reductase activating protein [Dissulfurispiraceae bacterium]|nr:anaerobic ribonucleoside-triphosphate reductase activating protein [Dissulfurispiraceae bacterium]